MKRWMMEFFFADKIITNYIKNLKVVFLKSCNFAISPKREIGRIYIGIANVITRHTQ